MCVQAVKHHAQEKERKENEAYDKKTDQAEHIEAEHEIDIKIQPRVNNQPTNEVDGKETQGHNARQRQEACGIGLIASKLDFLKVSQVGKKEVRNNIKKQNVEQQVAQGRNQA
jgi:hypothetical protein